MSTSASPAFVSRSLSIRVDADPEPTPRPRVFRNGGVLSRKTAFHHAVWGEALKARPPAPISGPVLLDVEFVFARPRSVGLDDLKATRPDVDNLVKSVMDALTEAHWWGDDGQVAELRARKRWAMAGEAPGARVLVRPLPPRQNV